MPTLLVYLPSEIRAYRIGDDVMLGRDRSCSIVVDQSGVSHQHAMIRSEHIAGEPYWILEDLNSKNGTRQNRKRITTSVVLSPQDTFTLGKWRVDFRLADVTCAACHGPLDQGETVHACATCGTLSHASCRNELNECPVLGCGQTKQTEKQSEEETGETSTHSEAAATVASRRPQQPGMTEQFKGVSPNARAYMATDIDVIDERPAWAAMGLMALPGLLSFGAPVAILAMIVSRGSTRIRVVRTGRFEAAAIGVALLCAVVSSLWWFGDLQQWIRGQ